DGGWQISPYLRSMFRHILYWIASKPGLFLFFRKAGHFHFITERGVIRRYFSFLPPGSGILHIACESGYFSNFFKDYSYTGVDLSEAKIAYARKHFKGDFKVMDAMALEFEPGTFDGILLAGVFHNIDDITSMQVLREAKRVLKPEGRVLILEDYYADGAPGLFERFDRYFDPPEVIRNPNQYLELFTPHIRIHYKGLIRSGSRKMMVFQSDICNPPSAI
ncbi:MAG: class I SAM-dependent methyltransferase, partial [Bacteroidetes bacterium]|nr:class I SAM-dependent methyltransferase [Bacteroidota bacterium]